MKPSALRTQRLIKRAKSVAQRGALIIDDDGDLVFSDNALLGEKEFLDQRLYPLKNVNVGSVAWCIMWGIAVGGGNTSSYWKTQMNGAKTSGWRRSMSRRPLTKCTTHRCLRHCCRMMRIPTRLPL